MIYDCFLWNGETDQVAMRVEELAPLGVEHRAVIGTRTFQGALNAGWVLDAEGLPCPAYVCNNWLGDGASPWDREAYQRNAIADLVDGRGRPDDLVIVSDADEIPRASVVKELAAHPWANETIQMRHAMYYFAIDLRCTWDHDYGPVMATAFTLRRRGAQRMRTAPDASVEGGWHFSYLGGADAVVRKMRAYSHTEFSHLTEESITECIRDRHDYDGRGVLERVPIDDSYPACIRDDPKRWEHLLWQNVR